MSLSFRIRSGLISTSQQSKFPLGVGLGLGLNFEELTTATVCLFCITDSQPPPVNISCLSWCSKKPRPTFPLVFDAAELCCDVMMWDSACVGFWCDATLFSAPRSSDFCLNTHRDESPFLLAHTVNEALFCRTAAETQRARAQWLFPLSAVCTRTWHEI